VLHFSGALVCSLPICQALRRRLQGVLGPEHVAIASLNTVSTHMRNIYAKLQARDRSSAVQRARELRLLPPGPTR
jgi:hypothetical protein